MAEDNPLPLDPTGSQSLMEAQLSLSDVTPFVNLPAKPLAYEPNLQIKGNPIIGADPGVKTDSPDFGDAFENAITNYQGKENRYEVMKPFTYSGDYDASKFERYYSTGKLYDKLGFSPYRDNESLYNNKMTRGDEFVRAAKQWDDLVGAGFMSGLRAWKTIFTDPLAPDLEGARDMQRAMAIGSSTTGGIGSFFINTFLNSGYTVGIGADFLAEELALAGATVLSGGALGETTVPAMLGKAASAVGKGVDAFKNIFNVANKAEDISHIASTINRFSGIRAIDNVNDARNFWNTVGTKAKNIATGTLDILNPLDNTVAALRAKDYATDFAKVSRTFGAFADDLMMMKGAVSEAQMEGGMAKIDITEKLIDEHRKKTGVDPTGEELSKIEAIAHNEALTTALWNLPAITTSNKLMYATMLAPFRKIMGTKSAKLWEDIVFDKGAFRAAGTGIAERAASAAKSLAKPKFYGQFGMQYLKANLAEGVQENLQEAISSGAASHAKALYSDPIRGAYEGFMPHFMKGMGEQFSAQGAETFAGGFAMGLFAQPIMGGAGVGVSKIMDATINRKNAEALKEARDKQLNGYVDEKTGEKVKGDVEILNELYANNLKYFAPDLENAVRTGRLANDMYTAAREGDKKGAVDAKEALQTHHIMTAIRTGKYDIFMDKLADYKNFNDKETVEAFEKYGIEKEDYEKASAQIDGVIDRAKRVKENYETTANQFPNPYVDYKHGGDPATALAAIVSKKAWDEAVYNLVFAKSTFQDYSKRVEDLSKAFSQVSAELAGTDSQSMMSLLSPKTAMLEVQNLKNEIKVLDESIPEQKKIKAQKMKQLEKLVAFTDSLAEVKTKDTEAGHAKAKKAFGNYVQELAKKNDTIVFNQALDNAYDLVKDSMLLKNDMQGLAQSINVMMAPDSFLKFHKKLYDTYTDVVNEKPVTMESNSVEFTKTQDIQAVANTITKQTGLFLPNDFLVDYNNARTKGEEIPYPDYFEDQTGELITSEDPRFYDATVLWDNFVHATTGPQEAAPWEETINKALSERELDKIIDQIDKAKEMTPDLLQAISKKRDDLKTLPEAEQAILDKFNAYPQTTQDSLMVEYNKAKQEKRIPEDTSLATFISTDPNALIIINVDKTRDKLNQEASQRATEPVKKEEPSNYTQKMPGGYTTRFNKESRRWEFVRANGRMVTTKKTLGRLVNKLSTMPGIIPTWFTKFITDEERNQIRTDFEELVNRSMREGEKIDMRDGVTHEQIMMEALQGAKFKPSSDLTENVADVSSAWKSAKGYPSVDNFVTNELAGMYHSYGQEMTDDTQTIINEVYDMINKFPKGIKDKDIKAYRDSLGSTEDLDALREKFAEKYGIDIDKAYHKLDSLNLLNYSEAPPEGVDVELPPAELDLNPVPQPTPVSEAPVIPELVKDIHQDYEGKIIYVTPGSGKTKLAKTNEDVIDADALLVETIGELLPDFPISDQLSYAQNIFDAIRYGKIDKAKMYAITRGKMKEMAAKGKTVVHSSKELMKDSDYVMIQTNEDFVLEKHDQMDEVMTLNKLEDAYSIGITKDITDALKRSVNDLIGNNVVEPTEITETQEVTIEDINKNLTTNNLQIAQDRGYDAIYKNNRYAITKVDQNSVTLKTLDGSEITVEPSEISAVTTKEDVVTTVEENKDFKGNNTVLSTGDFDVDFDANDLGKAADDITKNIC